MVASRVPVPVRDASPRPEPRRQQCAAPRAPTPANRLADHAILRLGWEAAMRRCAVVPTTAVDVLHCIPPGHPALLPHPYQLP